MAHKPGDQTIPAAPDFSGKKGAKSSARTDKYIKTETGWKRAVGEDMAGELFQKALTPSEAAPVVSQGAWRERAFIPRGVMARDAMLQALRDELAKVLEVGGNPARLVEPLLEAWLPVLRQGVEQAGGDSLDAWLAPMLRTKPLPRPFPSALLDTLGGAVEVMRAATGLEPFTAAAQGAIAAIEQATENPRRISFKVLERELEGKLEVHELLQIRFATVAQIRDRLEELGGTMDSIRDQLKSMPGAKPDGMYSNFARLKAEARLLTAELKRRGA